MIMTMGSKPTKAEEFLSKDVKVRLSELEQDLENLRHQALPAEELTERLSRFLLPYRDYRALLDQKSGENR